MKKILGYVVAAILLVAIYFIVIEQRRPLNAVDGDLYGKRFNNFRVENRLPIIEDSWVIRIHDSTHVRWSHASTFNKRGTPEHIWKTLYFKNSVLFAEEDAFNYDQGDSVGDRLIVVTNFENPDSTKYKFSRHYYKSFPPSRSVNVNFEFADSVLNKWGFDSLYSGAKLSIPKP